MDNIVYNIRKNGRIIGNMHKEQGYLSLAIVDVIDILDNYNANLVNSKMNGSLLAVRMFEHENEKGNKSFSLKPAIYKDSRNSIADFHPTFRLTSNDRTRMELGNIATIQNDILRNMDLAECGVEIDLDTCSVSFIDLCFRYGYKIWEDKFKKKKSDLNFTSYNLSNVAFNELSDLYDFVKENIYGWLDESMPNMVYVPTFIDK